MDPVLLPSRHEAQLRFFSLDEAPSECAALVAVLDPEERARAERFRFEHDRTAYIVAHGRLRELLGACLGLAPAEVMLLQPQGEKPVLAETNGLHFSLSHSGRIGMVGLATCAVGVDVEVIRSLSDRDEIARRYFARAEVRGLSTLPEAARHQAFFACWTRKEAYLKAIGIGLAAPLDQFEVSLDQPARLLEVAGEPAEPPHWSFWGDRVGAVAWAAATARDPLMSWDVSGVAEILQRGDAIS